MKRRDFFKRAGLLIGGVCFFPGKALASLASPETVTIKAISAESFSEYAQNSAKLIYDFLTTSWGIKAEEIDHGSFHEAISYCEEVTAASLS